MIIYGLLKLVMIILDAIASIFGEHIPSFPSAITDLLNGIAEMISGGISFVNYFFDIVVVTALISLVIAWYGFRTIKDAIMKVIGHFIGN